MPYFRRTRDETLKVVFSSKKSAADQPPSTHKPKRLVLLRHAKSSWDNPSLRDHDRPLSKRGRSAAGRVALKLKELGWLPDLILCSDALRTRQTLDLMCEAVSEFHAPAVHFLGSFYSVAATDGHTAKHLEDMVLRFGQADISTVMCMGHNRGWEEAATKFSGTHVELKTANAALLECPNPHSGWEEAFQAGWLLKAIAKPGE